MYGMSIPSGKIAVSWMVTGTDMTGGPIAVDPLSGKAFVTVPTQS
jgi:hypothetical protein